MPDFALNPHFANCLDPMIEHGHPDVNGKPAFSRHKDGVEIAYRPEEAARIHSFPIRKQRVGKPPEPNIVFIAVRQYDPREKLGWRAEHFMSFDEKIAETLGIDMELFRKVLAEAQTGSVKDRNDFALKVLYAFARFQPDAAALLRGLVLPDEAEVDVFLRAHLTPL